MLRKLLLILTALIALTACQPGGAGGQVSSTGGLEVWLDQPPDGASIPLAAFTLKAHARDETGPGVQAIAFYVNGIPQASVSTDPSLPLAYAETPWNPAAPGMYEITAEASNGISTVLSAVAHVCVGDTCENAVAEVTQPTEEKPTVEGPTFTPINTLTLVPTNTPTPTLTPTATPCALSAPVPTDPANGDAVFDPNPTLSWTYTSRTCQPQSYRIDLCSDDACATVVQSGGTGNPSTSWAPADPVADCSIYYWRVAGVIGSTLGPYSTIFHFATAFPGGCGQAADTNPPSVRVPNAPNDKTTPTNYGQCGPNQPTVITFTADVRDDTAVNTVTLYWRYRNTAGNQFSDWFSLPMNLVGENNYSATFDNNSSPYITAVSTITGGSNGYLEYEIRAFDTAKNQQSYNGVTQIGYCIG